MRSATIKQKSKSYLYILVLFCLLIFLLQTALAFEYSEDIQEQITSLTITNSVYSTASRLDANLTLIPVTDFRQTSSMKTFPNAEPTSSGILFSFKEKGKLLFGLTSNITTKFVLRELQGIPLTDLPLKTNTTELNFYKKSSNYSDSDNPLIRNKAQQITQKTNNSIEVLYLLAEYVHNSMEYNLDYQELKKASVILEQKKGVCAQYTILFISLARSLGFPARYVSGVAYSNLINDSQEHAWAEVYFPGYGWVPYDTTFGQYSYIDTSHIILKKSLDAGEASVKYSYIRGYIQTDQISIDTQILDYKPKTQENFPTNISLKLQLYKDKVSQDSYVPLEVNVKNNNDYYISLPISVSIGPGVYGNKSRKILLLEPNSQKKVFFILYLPEEYWCKKNCGTYANITVSDSFHDSSTTNMTFSDFFDKVTLQEAQRMVDEQTVSEIDFYCISNSTVQDANKSVLCSIKPQVPQSMKICYQNSCTERFFEKNQETQVPFEIKTNESDACFILQNNNLSLDSCVTFENKENKNFFHKIWDIFISFLLKLVFHISEYLGYS